MPPVTVAGIAVIIGFRGYTNGTVYLIILKIHQGATYFCARSIYLRNM